MFDRRWSHTLHFWTNGLLTNIFVKRAQVTIKCPYTVWCCRRSDFIICMASATTDVLTLLLMSIPTAANAFFDSRDNALLSQKRFLMYHWIAVKLLFRTVHNFYISTWFFHACKLKLRYDLFIFNINSLQLHQNNSKPIFYTLNL